MSNQGKVFSIRSNIILKPKINKDGYYEVNLYKGKNNHRTVHRLVALHFVEMKEGCNVVNHLDSNKLNNNSNNLEWTTVSGNTKHCFQNNEKFRKQVLGNLEKINNEKLARRWCR